jgi:tetratricopeptide (TPR) repeat protein
LNMIKTGRLLPLPSQPRHGVTSQPAAGRVKTGELPPGDVVAQLDPVSETLQKSLSALAALLFDQDEQEMNIRRGMADIVRGAFGADSGQVEQTKIMLHLSQVIEYHSRKKDTQAAEELEKAIEIGLEHPAAYFSLGCFQVAQKRSEKAINNLERVTGHPEYALAVHILLGQAQMELQQHHAAVMDLLEALKLAEMQVVLADQSALLGQAYDPIIESQAEIRDGAPPIRLCETIMEMLARPDWRAYLQEARKQLPDQDESNPTPLADLITAAGSREVVDALSSLQQLTRKGKYNAAMEQAFHALRTAPFYLPLHVAIGDVLLQEGQFGPALDKFNTVARSYEIRGETNRAISLYRKIADLSPLDMAAHNNLITLMIANGRNDDAINEYLVLSELYYNLADLGNVQNSINEAMRLAVQSNASKAVKLKVLGHQLDIELQSLNWRQAQKTYEQIRALQPEDEATRFALIDLDFRLEQEKKAEAEIANFVNYMAQRRMMDKVVSFMNQLAEKYPQQPLVLRQYAEVLRQMGRREEAIQKLDIAGDLYMQAGNKNATMEVVMAILAMNPPNAAEYQQLLAQLRGG